MFVLCSTTENQAGVSVSVPAAYFDAALPCRASATKSRVQRSRAATTASSGASNRREREGLSSAWKHSCSKASKSANVVNNTVLLYVRQ